MFGYPFIFPPVDTHQKLLLKCLVLDVVKLDKVANDGQVRAAPDSPTDDGLGGVDVHRYRVGEVVHNAGVPRVHDELTHVDHGVLISVLPQLRRLGGL